MSVLDDFRDAEQRVAQRLKELEPAVAEYHELEVVAQRLGIDASSAAPAPARTRRRKRSSPPAKANGASAPARRRQRTAPTTADGPTPATRGRARTAPGKRDEQLLALIRERPGITVAEAGKTLSVDPTGLYRVVGRLEQRGDVRKNGRNLEPVSTGSSE